MFRTVAAARIKIISSQKIDRRAMMIIAISFGMGLGVQLVPQVLNHFPETLKNIFSSPITTGGLTAIITNLAIPEHKI